MVVEILPLRRAQAQNDERKKGAEPLIAQGLSPFSPVQAALKAGKLVLEQIKELADKTVDFGFETTLSGKGYIKYFQSLKKQDYKLHVFFLQHRKV